MSVLLLTPGMAPEDRQEIAGLLKDAGYDVASDAEDSAAAGCGVADH